MQQKKIPYFIITDNIVILGRHFSFGNGSVVIVVIVVVVVDMHHTPSDERWGKGRARGGSL